MKGINLFGMKCTEMSTYSFSKKLMLFQLH